MHLGAEASRLPWTGRTHVCNRLTHPGPYPHPTITFYLCITLQIMIMSQKCNLDYQSWGTEQCIRSQLWCWYFFRLIVFMLSRSHSNKCWQLVIPKWKIPLQKSKSWWLLEWNGGISEAKTAGKKCFLPHKVSSTEEVLWLGQSFKEEFRNYNRIRVRSKPKAHQLANVIRELVKEFNQDHTLESVKKNLHTANIWGSSQCSNKVLIFIKETLCWREISEYHYLFVLISFFSSSHPAPPNPNSYDSPSNLLFIPN